MTATFLTVDLGNTRLKARAWASLPGGTGGTGVAGPEQPLESADLAGDPEHLGVALSSWLADLVELTGPVHAALSSVAAPQVERAIEASLAALCVTVAARPEPGLDIRCREPELVGSDRLWAARGALAVVGGSLLVVDVGTALTVDAVDGGEGRAIFHGGAIAPGPALLARSLADGAARLPSVDPRSGAPALGRDTEGAIQAGVAVGLRGAARELAGAVGEEAGLESPAVVLTGGGRSYLLEPRPVFAAARVVPDLIHRGLLAQAFGELR